MNGYIEAGYIVVLGTLGTYAVILVKMSHSTNRRLARIERERPDDHL